MFKSFETLLSSKSKGRLKYGFAERLRELVCRSLKPSPCANRLDRRRPERKLLAEAALAGGRKKGLCRMLSVDALERSQRREVSANEFHVV
jgi:hypothetical protein